MTAAWMAQMPSQGYRTWTCACGRLGLAVALETCPECGEPQPVMAEPAPSAPVTVLPAGAQPTVRRRTRTRRGG